MGVGVAVALGVGVADAVALGVAEGEPLDVGRGAGDELGVEAAVALPFGGAAPALDAAPGANVLAVVARAGAGVPVLPGAVVRVAEPVVPPPVPAAVAEPLIVGLLGPEPVPIAPRIPPFPLVCPPRWFGARRPPGSTSEIQPAIPTIAVTRRNARRRGVS